MNPETEKKTLIETPSVAPLMVAASSKYLLDELGAAAVGTAVVASPLLVSTLLAAGAFYMGKLFSDDNGADGDGKILESLQRTSLENRIADLREQLASAPEQAGAARLDVWFSGKAVYGSQGISAVFMRDTIQALVGMIQSSARDKVRRLKEQKKKAEMPRGKFYVTALTHGSFGYELTYKDNEGMLFDDPAIVESIKSTMDVIEETTVQGLDMDALIQQQPIRMLANLKDFFSTLKKQGSTLRVESGSNALSLDSRHVETGFDNICLSDIIDTAHPHLCWQRVPLADYPTDSQL